MRIARMILSISVTVALIAAGFGIIAAPEVNAASKLPEVPALQARTNQTSVTLSWSKLNRKQLKKVKGIAIYRNGTLIKSIGKKSGSYTDFGLKAGTRYSYTVKTYKTTKKKEWFNTKTQKWQKKKPARKWRGQSRKAKAFSKGVSVSATTTASGPQAGSDGSQGESNDPQSGSGDSQSGGQNPGSGTEPGTGGGQNPGTSDPVTVTGTFSINVPASMVMNGKNLINIRQGEVQIPITMPAHVKKIEWKSVRVTIANSKDTMSYRTENDGKKFYLKAEEAVNSNGGMGVLKFKGTLTMEDGYIFDGNTTASFQITNTVYPMVGSDTSNPVYNWKDVDVAKEIVLGMRAIHIYNKLPNNATINLNINEWQNGYNNTSVPLKLDSDWELLDPDQDCKSILLHHTDRGLIHLIQAGDFKLKLIRPVNGHNYDQYCTFHLTGSGAYMMGYHNHLKAAAAQCKTSSEMDTIINCIAYIYTHYYYKKGGDLYKDGYGDCGGCSYYLAHLLRYCGIWAYQRSAQIEYAPNPHDNNAVILSDGTKYIVDGTAGTHVYTEEEARYWLTGEPGESPDDVRSHRICKWDDYKAYYYELDIDFY